MADLEIRNMCRNEFDLAVEWAAREGWNPGLHDAECFYNTDPEGYFAALLDGEMVGSISAVAYDDAFGFVGFYIVKPEYRGHRVGIELGRAGMTYLGGRNVGLDGVENKMANYRTHGFRLAYHNYRYEGVVRHDAVDAAHICAVSEVPFELIAEYDRSCFPAERTVFLDAWLNLPDSMTAAYMEHEQLRGYGLVRTCRNGYKVGPLFADDAQVAQTLYQQLMNYCIEENAVYLDVPEVNAAAKMMVERHGMKTVFGTARMYNREAPAIRLDRIFGVTSFELG